MLQILDLIETELQDEVRRLNAEPGAAMTLLRYYARQAVKEDMLNRGISIYQVESGQIWLASEAYLAEHWRELLPQRRRSNRKGISVRMLGAK